MHHTFYDNSFKKYQFGNIFKSVFNTSLSGGVIPRKSKTMDNGHLLIPLLRAEDEGCYRCNMNNTSGAVFAEACLSVLGLFLLFVLIFRCFPLFKIQNKPVLGFCLGTLRWFTNDSPLFQFKKGCKIKYSLFNIAEKIYKSKLNIMQTTFVYLIRER